MMNLVEVETRLIRRKGNSASVGGALVGGARSIKARARGATPEGTGEESEALAAAAAAATTTHSQSQAGRAAKGSVLQDDAGDSHAQGAEAESCSADAEDAAAPEGGWSWLIVVSIALSKMAFWGALPCFGLVFADVLQTAPGSEGAAVASVMSAFTICLDSAGLFCPAFYRKFTYRQVAVAGGLIYFAGSLSASFASSVSQLIITYGFVQGAGFGLMLSASLASFNEHF
ncbi:uncharacterized protein GBIM_16389, partial [Gryllus bimaculatus]